MLISIMRKSRRSANQGTSAAERGEAGGIIASPAAGRLPQGLKYRKGPRRPQSSEALTFSTAEVAGQVASAHSRPHERDQQQRDQRRCNAAY
jgi:hypothetical protein